MSLYKCCYDLFFSCRRSVKNIAMNAEILPLLKFKEREREIELTQSKNPGHSTQRYIILRKALKDGTPLGVPITMEDLQLLADDHRVKSSITISKNDSAGVRRPLEESQEAEQILMAGLSLLKEQIAERCSLLVKALDNQSPLDSPITIDDLRLLTIEYQVKLRKYNSLCDSAAASATTIALEEMEKAQRILSAGEEQFKIQAQSEVMTNLRFK